MPPCRPPGLSPTHAPAQRAASPRDRRRGPTLLLVAVALALSPLVPTPADALLRGVVVIHCTKEGETPKKIARRYGVKLSVLKKSSGGVQRLLAANRKIRKDNARRKALAKKRYKAKLRQWKKTPRKKRGKRPKLSFKPKPQKTFGHHEPVRVVRATKNTEYRDAVLRLSRGARASWVAKTFGVPESLVRCVNRIPKRAPGVGCKRSRIPGKRARWLPRYRSKCDGGRTFLSVRLPFAKPQPRPRGLPTAGHLRHGEKFPKVPGIVAKQPQHTYAAAHTITRLIEAVGFVHKRLAETPDIVLGDIARKGGGRFKPHRSHQNGLDVDLGYYHLGKVRKDRFTKVTAKNFDKVRTWALLKRLLESGEVQYIFVSERVQKLLRPFVVPRYRQDAAWCLRFVRTLSDRRRYGRPRKVRRRRGSLAGWARCVKRAFGHRGYSNALIRHAKGHDDHMHIRFFPRGGRWRRGGAP